MAKENKNKKYRTFIIFVIVLLIFGGLSILRMVRKLREQESLANGTGDELQVIALEMRGKYGDSFIIKYNNFEMLVDAGTKTDKEYVQQALDEFVTDDKLDILMLSHLHGDHIGDMTDVSFFKDIEVLKIVDAGSKPTSDVANEYVAMRDALVEKGATYTSYYDIITKEEIEDIWYLDSEKKLYLEFFDSGYIASPGTAPGDLNDSSIAFALNYNNNKWFFAGDLPEKCEDKLITNIKKINSEYFKESDYVVFKSCHHGSREANGDTLLSFVKPDMAFIMAGILTSNQSDSEMVEQHPYYETLERMKKYTDKVYWSSINGLTIFKSTGNEVTFSARGRTVDYYYNHELASRESEKLVTIFESKWYKALQELKNKEKTTS